jgi:hypothetical protein
VLQSWAVVLPSTVACEPFNAGIWIIRIASNFLRQNKQSRNQRRRDRRLAELTQPELVSRNDTGLLGNS